MPCSRQSCATGTPPSAWRRIAMICASLYLLFFIQILLRHLAEKILLMKTLKFRGDYRRAGRRQRFFVQKAQALGREVRREMIEPDHPHSFDWQAVHVAVALAFLVLLHA